MKIGYARVSTEDQNLILLFYALEQAGCKKLSRPIRCCEARTARASGSIDLSTTRRHPTNLEEKGIGFQSVQERLIRQPAVAG